MTSGPHGGGGIRVAGMIDSWASLHLSFILNLFLWFTWSKEDCSRNYRVSSKTEIQKSHITLTTFCWSKQMTSKPIDRRSWKDSKIYHVILGKLLNAFKPLFFFIIYKMRIILILTSWGGSKDELCDCMKSTRVRSSVIVTYYCSPYVFA